MSDLIQNEDTSSESYNYAAQTPNQLILDTESLLTDIKGNTSDLFNVFKNNYNLTDSQLDNIENTLKKNESYTNNALKNLTNITTATQNNLDAASNNLVNQTVVNDVLGTEIANTQAEFETLRQNNINQRRLLENNTYYTQRYEAHTDVMKTIIIICIPLLLITILGNKEIIPPNVSYWLGGIGLLIGLGIVGMKVFDLYYRNNFNYNEYDQPFYNPLDQKDIDAGKQYSITQALVQDFSQLGKNLEKNLGTCIGSDCCSQGMVWNQAKRKCELSKSTELATNGGQ